MAIGSGTPSGGAYGPGAMHIKRDSCQACSGGHRLVYTYSVPICAAVARIWYRHRECWICCFKYACNFIDVRSAGYLLACFSQIKGSGVRPFKNVGFLRDANVTYFPVTALLGTPATFRLYSLISHAKGQHLSLISTLQYLRSEYASFRLETNFTIIT